ncbi:Exosome complex component RRP43 [Porites harrisoni]
MAGSISTAEGSALVKLGNTTVVCGVKAEFAVPSQEKPKLGFIVPNVDLPPLCSSRFRPGPPSEQAQVLSQFVADIISNCEPISLEDLCILEGKLCWVLYVDIMCLSYDGNITDACLIAAVAALQNCGSPLTDDKLQECFKKSVRRGKEVRDLIQTACDDIDR